MLKKSILGQIVQEEFPLRTIKLILNIFDHDLDSKLILIIWIHLCPQHTTGYHFAEFENSLSMIERWIRVTSHYSIYWPLTLSSYQWSKIVVFIYTTCCTHHCSKYRHPPSKHDNSKSWDCKNARHLPYSFWGPRQPQEPCLLKK